MYAFIVLSLAVSLFNAGLTAYGLFGPDWVKYKAYVGKLVAFLSIWESVKYYEICYSSGLGWRP